MTYLSDFNISHTVEAEVTSSERITPADVAEVRSIMLKIDAPDFSCRQGQNVGVTVPGRSEFGQEKHFRLYTIANSPGESQEGPVEIELCVRRCFYLDEFSGE